MNMYLYATLSGAGALLVETLRTAPKLAIPPAAAGTLAASAAVGAPARRKAVVAVLRDVAANKLMVSTG